MALLCRAVPCVLCAGDYWGWWKPARSYHHTGPVSTFYALREALAIVGEEGLPAMWDRHLQVSGDGGRGGHCQQPLLAASAASATVRAAAARTGAV